MCRSAAEPVSPVAREADGGARRRQRRADQGVRRPGRSYGRWAVIRARSRAAAPHRASRRSSSSGAAPRRVASRARASRSPASASSARFTRYSRSSGGPNSTIVATRSANRAWVSSRVATRCGIRPFSRAGHRNRVAAVASSAPSMLLPIRSARSTQPSERSKSVIRSSSAVRRQPAAVPVRRLTTRLRVAPQVGRRVVRMPINAQLACGTSSSPSTTYAVVKHRHSRTAYRTWGSPATTAARSGLRRPGVRTGAGP